MPDPTPSPGGDFLLRAVGLGGRVRAVAAVTTGIVERLRRIHDTSPTVTAAMGRIATGTLLLAASLEKVSGREPMVTVEVDGGGPAGRFLATASPSGWVRATVQHPRASAPARDDGKLDVPAVVGTTGRLIVTRDPGIGEPYRGVVELVSGEMAKDFAHYLNESEQTPSAVALGVFVVPTGHVAHAGGYLLQLLAGVSEDEASELARRVERLGWVTDRLRRDEGPESWLAALLPGDVEIVERIAARFCCGCSIERVERAVKLLGAEEIRELLDRSATEPVSLVCGFCRKSYHLSRDDLGRLLLEVETESARRPPS